MRKLKFVDDSKPGITRKKMRLGWGYFRPDGTRISDREEIERLNKIGEGSPNVVDQIESDRVSLVINTPTGGAARSDGYEIRRSAVAKGIPCITTISGGMAAARAIAAARLGAPEVL